MLEAADYSSLDELMERLILDVDSRRSVPSQMQHRTGSSPGAEHDVLAERPTSRAAIELADPAPPLGRLQFLTNRFGPLKVATRVLANMSQDAEWPEVGAFQTQAAAVARRIGQRLRAEDAKRGTRGASRRWIAYPVGEDERAASERYAFSFTLLADDVSATGPLAQLGLADVRDGRAVLTERGWELAAAPSPTLDGDGLGTLSSEEVSILRACLQGLPDEEAAIAEFVKAVRLAAGMQGRVDEMLGVWHPEWTADRAAAERSAMLGRLGELGVLKVSGRGPSARIDIVDSVAWRSMNREDGISDNPFA